MQRRDLILAVRTVLVAIESTAVLNALRPEKGREAPARLRALRDYALRAAAYAPPARALTKIFKLDLLEDPDCWMQILAGDGPVLAPLSRALLVVKSELPKFIELLSQETVSEAEVGAGPAGAEPILAPLRVTFVEEQGKFSTVQRVVDGLSACQELYDGLARLMGETSTPLVIAAIDSGSDKSFDLFGAAALMKEFRELIVSLWGLVVFHREHKLGKRLELIAASLPILERVAALEQSAKLGREEAQIIRGSLVDGAKKFVAAGMTTDELDAHASHSPRALLAPEPRLLTGPTADPASERRASAGQEPAEARDRRSTGPSMSDSELERLAELLDARRGKQSGSSIPGDDSSPG